MINPRLFNGTFSQNYTGSILNTGSSGESDTQNTVDNVKILIAEDSRASADLMRAIIDIIGKADVTVVENGEEVLSLLSSKTKFDLIILDIMMPKLNGLDTLKKIRENSSNVNLPIFIVSALSDNETITKGIELGANDYLTKPISKDVFKAKVSFLLNQKRRCA